MSAEIPFDLMEAVRLDTEQLERESPNSQVSAQERQRLREQLGLVTAIIEHRGHVPCREVIWAHRDRKTGAIRMAFHMTPVRYLIHSTLAE